MKISDLLLEYESVFKTIESPRIFFAPGRINLIGEHTDYNGGIVLPASISLGTYALAQKRDDQKILLYSLNFPETGIIEIDPSDLPYKQLHEWANYPKGMINYMHKNGMDIPTGLNILFYGNIPNGAGLSSSASIEMATGVLLETLFDLKIEREKIIQIGQKVENDYIGVNSGIMDQFAIGNGKKNHAILLNCQTLEFRYTPIPLHEHTIIIINSNKQRTLAASKYNERRLQCEEALDDLRTELNIDNLCSLTTKQFEQHKHLIKDETNQKRAKHVIYENERTLEAHKQLQLGNLGEFGLLMNESHRSLKRDFEVTGTELDQIIQSAWEQPGVVGARMTGAGFGGCAIAIVKKDMVDSFIKNVNKEYAKVIGYEASFYTATTDDGAREIKKECKQ